ncbi:hypothetical protein QA645_22620 [Bradyrhizobium sp. CIAT3101]|uniref:hypothetical protein n=1 Tax=Bradyrhizobium sp. CIAT3101 TaxID=439387 RepID=UPI0024B11BAC|nr:hypothetical protein [Bradyrhizobium sp. CIAT3101]WFU77353.1 hypothetical protein QA645_22620 [Bradyrhizobium sp. CIAT3101]
MTGAKRLEWQDSNANIPNRAQLSVRRKSALSLVVAPIASELMPGQGQFDQSLPIGPFGRRGALHRRLGFMLGVVLGTHAAKFNRPIWTSAWQFRPYDCGGRKSHRRARFRTMVPRRICRCDRELRGLASRRRCHVKSAKTGAKPDCADLRIFLILQTAGPVDGFTFGVGCDGYCPLGNSVLPHGAARTNR